MYHIIIYIYIIINLCICTAITKFHDKNNSVQSTFQSCTHGLAGTTAITHSSGILWVALLQSRVFSRVTPWVLCCSLLVLNILVSAISSRDDCAGLKFHAWYLDDGALAGPRSTVSNILALLQELGPPLGLHVNIPKCEVFSQSSLDCFPSDIKKSTNSNIDILGSPIGDTEFCHQFTPSLP